MNILGEFQSIYDVDSHSINLIWKNITYCIVF